MNIDRASAVRKRLGAVRGRGTRAVSYIQSEINPQMAISLVHCLNRDTRRPEVPPRAALPGSRLACRGFELGIGSSSLKPT